MPVILGNEAVAEWLDPEIHEQKALEKILQPSRSEWLTAVEISPLVNSAKNKRPDCIRRTAKSRSACEQLVIVGFSGS